MQTSPDKKPLYVGMILLFFTLFFVATVVATLLFPNSLPDSNHVHSAEYARQLWMTNLRINFIRSGFIYFVSLGSTGAFFTVWNKRYQ